MKSDCLGGFLSLEGHKVIVVYCGFEIKTFRHSPAARFLSRVSNLSNNGEFAVRRCKQSTSSGSRPFF